MRCKCAGLALRELALKFESRLGKTIETPIRPPTLHSPSQAMAAEAGRKLRRAWQVLLPTPDAANRRQNASASSLLGDWARSYAHRFPARADPASAPGKGWQRNW